MPPTKAEQIAALVAQRRAHSRAISGRTPRRIRVGRLPRQLQPDRIRLAYFRALRASVLAKLKQLVTEKLVPALPRLIAQADAKLGRRDAEEDDADALLEQIGAQMNTSFPNRDLESLAEQFARETSDFQRTQLLKQIRAAVGVDVLGSEPNLAGIVESFTDENVALIKSIPTEFLGDLSKRLPAMINDGIRSSELTDFIASRFGVAENRARLIARDQIGKFYGDLNKTRQQNLGVGHYIWRGMMDNRERPEHVAREGQRFAWDDPPEDGHPGEPVQCRCYPEPVLDHLLDALE